MVVKYGYSCHKEYIYYDVMNSFYEIQNMYLLNIIQAIATLKYHIQYSNYT